MNAISDRTSTAVVIPFPVRPNVANQRLATALAGLSAALDEQRAALAAWRGALLELRTAVGSIGTSLQTYSGALAVLKDDVETLHETATRLA